MLQDASGCLIIKQIKQGNEPVAGTENLFTNIDKPCVSEEWRKS